MHNLPLACRQLYQETHILVYRYGTFLIERYDWFSGLIESREDVKSAITQVKIKNLGVYAMMGDVLIEDLTSDFGRVLCALKNLERIFVEHEISDMDWGLDKAFLESFVEEFTRGRNVEIVYLS